MPENNSTGKLLYQVAVNAPLNNLLTYASDESLEAGESINVPLGKRTAKAVIINQTQEAGNYVLKKIKSKNEFRPALKPFFLNWLTWVSNYYFHPLGQVIETCYPPLEKKSGRTKTETVPLFDQEEPLNLMPEQDAAVKSITSQEGFHVNLLFGVTGSGKTEVYLQSLAKVISEGKKGIVLVPEISLTPQLLTRFSKRFPGQVAVIHSALTPREKTNQWWEMVDGKKNILIGARSALFCPIDNLGLIVVDEEHEASFKQDEKLKYNGRDSAIMLARHIKCPIVLGSATPSLETWNNVLEKRYKLLELKSRVEGRKLPQITVVDLKEEKKKKQLEKSELPFWLSKKLYEDMVETLEKKEQVALFLNRRGMAHTIYCDACGKTLGCPNCEISLTLHANNYCVCHYCDYHIVIKEECPECHEPGLLPLGLGTELIEKDIEKLFPEARLARADRDEIKNRVDLENLISDVENREIDILIGTQMIAKGLDFPGLTLVGIVLADISFNIPDFRSAERSFQLMTQVSGRSGRHIEDGGKVVIQTYNPDFISLGYALKNDFINYAKEELGFRKELSYPPFGRLASLKVSGNVLEKVEFTTNTLNKRIEALKTRQHKYENILALGPAKSPLFKIRGKYRYLFLIKSTDHNLLGIFVKQLLSDTSWKASGTKVQIDIDPLNML